MSRVSIKSQILCSLGIGNCPTQDISVLIRWPLPLTRWRPHGGWSLTTTGQSEDVLLQSNMIFLFWDQEYPMLTESCVKKTQNQPVFELIVTSQLLHDLIKESRLQITSSIKYMERAGNETPNLSLPSIVDYWLYKFFEKWFFTSFWREKKLQGILMIQFSSFQHCCAHSASDWRACFFGQTW